MEEESPTLHHAKLRVPAVLGEFQPLHSLRIVFPNALPVVNGFSFETGKMVYGIHIVMVQSTVCKLVPCFGAPANLWVCERT